jgi:hypothetical protein
MGTDFRKLYDSEFLYAYDLDGKPCTLTIDRVEAGTITGTGGKTSKKPVVYFREGKEKKGLALCKTNARTIAGMYGTAIEGWAGKKVTIYPTTCQFGRDTVECIRVKPTQGKATATNVPIDEHELPEPGANG